MGDCLGQNVQSWIGSIVQANDVVLFMKGTKQVPLCGYSGYIVQVLRDLGVDFYDVNVLANEDIRSGIKLYTNWPTVPQLFFKGEFIGGCDIVRQMHESGDLVAKLKEKALL